MVALAIKTNIFFPLKCAEATVLTLFMSLATLSCAVVLIIKAFAEKRRLQPSVGGLNEVVGRRATAEAAEADADWLGCQNARRSR